MMTRQNKQTAFRFNPETLAKLDKLAEDEYRNRSQIVHMLIDKAYKEKYGTDKLEKEEAK